MDSRLMRAAEVADVLGVSPWTVYAYARDGRLPSRELGPRCVRFAREDVESFVQACARTRWFR